MKRERRDCGAVTIKVKRDSRWDAAGALTQIAGGEGCLASLGNPLREGI